MSKRKRPKSLPAQSGGIEAPVSYGYGSGGSSGSGYTAADQSTGRGYVFFPNIDSKTNVSQYVRSEVSRKARWLEANVGLARHFANTLPRMAGPLIPQPATSDTEWNKIALEYFNRTQGSRLVHDQGGMENFSTRQKTILKRGLVDGDCFIGLTTTTTGTARTVFYEAPQVGSGTKQLAQDGWFDGVQTDRYGKKQAYSILEPGNYSREAQVIRADKILHCGRFESPQSPRGLTGFIHAINNMLDLREIDNDTKRGIKAGNIVGFYVTNQILNNIDAAPAAGKYNTKPDYRAINTATVADPKPIKFEALTEGGGAMLTLNQGQDLKTVNDSRPHQNQMDFKSYLVHDIAAGFSMPVESMWSISGISGPAVRFIMRMAEKTLKEMRSNLIEQFCQPYWVYAIALAQKSGAIPYCKDTNWWKCSWIAPSALTIDAGRDSLSGMKELREGGTTYQDWYGEDGDDWRKQFEQRGLELAYGQEIETRLGLRAGSFFGKEDKIPPPDSDKSQSVS
jgi:capsid protein